MEDMEEITYRHWRAACDYRMECWKPLERCMDEWDLIRQGAEAAGGRDWYWHLIDSPLGREYTERRERLIALWENALASQNAAHAVWRAARERQRESTWDGYLQLRG